MFYNTKTTNWDIYRYTIHFT